MNKKLRFVIIICIIISLSILLGNILFRLADRGIYYNLADDGKYITVTLYRNGASKVAKHKIDCIALNDKCYVKLPVATRDDGKVLGYSDNKNDTVAKYFIGEDVLVNKDTDLYVISYKENTLNIDNSNIDYLEKNSVSCKAYNENKSCKIKLPSYNKNGYENKGYSTSKSSLVGFIYAGDEYEMDKDSTMYPIYSTSSRHNSIKVDKVLLYQDSFIEIEKGCDESVYNRLLQYLDDIKVKAPFLLLGNKISFLTDNTFNEVWGERYVGMNYGPKSLRSVDIRCSSRVINDYYATMVHEMSHSWDFYYAKRYGDNISSQNDVINLYNKYKDQNPTIFREYSFSNLYEFVADMMKYYYFKYFVPRNPYDGLDYPSDTKKTVEKYVCISNNNYDDKVCK